MKRYRITVRSNGDTEFIADDELAGFLELGDPDLKRASHVEPIKVNGVMMWQADMSPVGGPLLPPTTERQASLDLEAEWLKNNYLNRGTEYGS